MRRSKIKTYHTNSVPFKVGVISDTQLPPTMAGLEASELYKENFKKALTVFQLQKADMILFAGDIGDLGTRFAFRTYMNAIEEVFGNHPPVIQTIMGNHDYWSKSASTWNPHKKAFRDIIGHAPWTHYVMNGYHFIGASPSSGNMTNGYKHVLKWLEREIAAAEKDTPDKPVFVLTHNQPVNTSYGSEDWGDILLGSAFEGHANVINFSGHVHYSVLDERSVWQGGYTVINTQSLSYTELEPGKENGTIPPHAEDTPMGYLIEFEKNCFSIKRLNFAAEKAGAEEKADKRWTFPLPYENDRRYAFEKRKAENKPPFMKNITWDISVVKNSATITFPAPADDDFIHSYKVIADADAPRYYFSDFYNGLADMKQTVTLQIEGLSEQKHHSITVYAVDSWDAETLCFTAQADA